jgi:purine-binding chemotaxis protein CheW
MERSPASDEAAPRVHQPPWAFFACSGKGYALRLDRVHEIVPPQPVTRLPGCGREVSGLIGLRGRVITVFDLGVLTGGPPAAAREDYRLVLIWRGERVIGLAVDEMVRIASPDPMSGDVIGADALTVGGREYGVLDPDRLFGPLLA